MMSRRMVSDARALLCALCVAAVVIDVSEGKAFEVVKTKTASGSTDIFYSNQCYLTHQSVPGPTAALNGMQPNPSLMQCYQFNTGACCKAGHDAEIKTAYESLLSDTCVRMFPHLEAFHCIGCNPDQPKFVDLWSNPPTIRICDSFANYIFNASKVDQFDVCGLNMHVTKDVATRTNASEYLAVDNAQACGVVQVDPSSGAVSTTASCEAQIVMPSTTFSDAQSFLNAMIPRYFEGFQVQIVDGKEYAGYCLSSAQSILPSIGVMLASFVLILFSSTSDL